MIAYDDAVWLEIGDVPTYGILQPSILDQKMVITALQKPNLNFNFKIINEIMAIKIGRAHV